MKADPTENLSPDASLVGPMSSNFYLVPMRGENGEPTSIKEAVEQVQRQVIIIAFRECEGNVSQVARRLKITRPTLYSAIHRLGLAEQFAIG